MKRRTEKITRAEIFRSHSFQNGKCLCDAVYEVVLRFTVTHIPRAKYLLSLYSSRSASTLQRVCRNVSRRVATFLFARKWIPREYFFLGARMSLKDAKERYRLNNEIFLFFSLFFSCLKGKQKTQKLRRSGATEEEPDITVE